MARIQFGTPDELPNLYSGYQEVENYVEKMSRDEFDKMIFTTLVSAATTAGFSFILSRVFRQ